MSNPLKAPNVQKLLRLLSAGNSSHEDLAVMAVMAVTATHEISDALWAVRMRLLSPSTGEQSQPDEVNSIGAIAELYRLSLQAGGLPAEIHGASGFLRPACVALLLAALGDSNDALRRQVLRAWSAARPPGETLLLIEQDAAALIQDIVKTSNVWLETLRAGLGLSVAALTQLAVAADNLLAYTYLATQSEALVCDGAPNGGHGGWGCLRALMEAALLLYNEMLPRVVHRRAGGRYSPQEWAWLHTACRRCVKAIWQVLCPVRRGDPAETASRVDTVVNTLLQAAAESPVSSGPAHSAVGALRAAVAGAGKSGGWAVLPAVHLTVAGAEVAARDLWLVYRAELRQVLLETVCSVGSSGDGLALEDAMQRADYLLSCFEASPNEGSVGDSSLLLLTLRHSTLCGHTGTDTDTDTSTDGSRTQGGGNSAVIESVQAAESASVTESVQALRQLFPDCGDVFLQACLGAFDQSLDRTVDALLTDNLPPGVSRLDRKIKAAWVGKAATDTALHVAPSSSQSALRGTAPAFVPALSEGERRAMLDRNRAYEQSFQEDARVLAAEYGDDYDDQFDDPSELSLGMSAGGDTYRRDGHAAGAATESKAGSAPKTGAGAEEGTTKSIRRAKKEKQRAAAPPSGGSLRGVGAAGVADVRRFNSLLRGEEAEAAFWEGMKNTNVQKERRRFDEEEGSDADSDAEPAAAAAAPPPGSKAGTANSGYSNSNGNSKNSGNNSNGSNINSSSGKHAPRGAPGPHGKQSGPTASAEDLPVGGSKPKHSSRKFDRHHQKDRSTRKFGGPPAL